MKIEDFLRRAADRGVQVRATRRGGFLYLEHGGRWIPLSGIEAKAELPNEYLLTLCNFLGLPPEDFELDPE